MVCRHQVTIQYLKYAAALKFCLKTCVAMKFVDDDDTPFMHPITIQAIVAYTVRQ